MPATYEPIATTTLGSAQANITFSSIPSTYTDLIVVFTPTRVTADTNAYFQLNGDTGTNYSYTQLYGDGTNAVSGRASNTSFIVSGYTTTGQQVQTIHIQNYSNTTTNKTVLIRQSNAGSAAQAIVGLWRSTAAINSIKLYLQDGNNLASGTTATLYGIKAA